ncbi:HAMP domain-containing sensor histidine kinase [Maridesulfovibrio bastinii]|uniref:HAMP domain-containing sensor histidine kinase n=1 Tax=Maridesulfovibrio bastinii TaxID=47157 RepID=UPI00041CAB09|nr:HAMP domain-containing sensor histidine kinase [Maridesulfovibrio bastinii]
MLISDNLSLKTKLFVVVLFLAVVCVSLPLALAYRQLNSDVVHEAESGAKEELALARRLLDKSDDSNIAVMVSSVSSLIGREIVFIGNDGELYSGASWLDSGGDLLNRPEVIAAVKDGTGFSHGTDPVTGNKVLYAAMAVIDLPDIPKGTLLIEEQIPKAGKSLETVRSVYLWSIPVIILLCYVSIRILVLQLSESVRSMVRTAEAVGQGNFKRRIRNLPGKEFLPLAESINWMAERIDEHVAIITGQKDKLQAVLNGMWDGVMVLDSECRINKVNRSMKEIVHGIEDSINRNPLEVISSPDFQDTCRQVISDDGPVSASIQLALDGDRVYEVNIVKSANSIGPGQGPGAIAVFHDISEIKRLEKVRQDFVANVSHELRTPLTSVKGYAETLLSDPPPPQTLQKSFLETIKKNADHMCKIVDDLLSLSRLEAGRAQTDFRVFDPVVCIEQAWEACSSLAEARGTVLESDLEDHENFIEADPDQLMQVFRNLFENAIKYGPEESLVEVVHRVDSGMLRIEVRDSGPGIPGSDQKRIFERFYSVQKHRRNEFGSTGLGLAISRHIVRNHGGDIWVESPPSGRSRGTSFIFTLPLAS